MNLPELKEGQSWCCGRGCGYCRPLETNFEYSRTTDRYGNLIESLTEKQWVSDCCEDVLQLWDENLQDTIEWSDFENDSVPDEVNGEEVGVSFPAWLARDITEWNGDPEDIMFIRMFWERNFYPSIEMAANDLHAKGLLPAGEYSIDIDW